MIYRAEVEVDDGSPALWFSNNLWFDDKDEAIAYAKELAQRWTLVKRARVVTSETPLKEEVDPADERIVVNYAVL